MSSVGDRLQTPSLLRWLVLQPHIGPDLLAREPLRGAAPVLLIDLDMADGSCEYTGAGWDSFDATDQMASYLLALINGDQCCGPASARNHKQNLGRHSKGSTDRM